MLDLHQTLDAEGKQGVLVFQKAIQPYKATGKTQASAYYRIQGKEVTTLEILARNFTQVLETGSRPAKTLVPSREMINELKPWAQSRGIPEEAVWGIAKKLLREGQKVNRNVYSEQMNEWADKAIDEVVNEFAGLAIDKIVEAW